MIKLLTLIPVWQRPQITRLTMDAIKDQIQEADFHGIKMEVLYVVSESWARRDAAQRGFRTVMTENRPLSRKMNTGLKHARKLDFDYLMQLGSDDLLHHSFWSLVLPPLVAGKPFFGFNKYYAYDSITQSAKVVNLGPTVTGAGRFVRRELLDLCEWRLWPVKANNGMDLKSEATILQKAFVFPMQVHADEPVICDIKSAVNIWKFEDLKGDWIDPETVRGLFPELQKLN